MPGKKYAEWLDGQGLRLLEGWAREGLSREEIAGRCGVTVRTLAHWAEQYEPIGRALAGSREATDYAVESALLDAALQGSVSAQIFWLKNRRGWRDRPAESRDGPEQLRVVVDV